MFESKRFDFYLFIPVILILIFSFGMVLSVSPAFFINHLVYVLIASTLFLAVSFVDFSILISLSPLIYIFCLVFLLLPFIFGTVTRGSVRWIPIGDYTIQPSEIIKPFLCLFAAWFWGKKIFSYPLFFKYSLAFLPVLIMIYLQPDLGSLLVIMCIFGGSILYSKIKLKQIGYFMLISLLLAPIFWFSLRSYQKTRFLHFLNPTTDPLGQGYNQIQAKITVGSGKFLGWGLGRGSQSHLNFLPERNTDFIFSSMAEEFGFVGSIILLTLYLFLFLRILRIASNCENREEFLTVITIFFSLAFQALVNVSMNLGLLPITGVTLPLFSYGGSSLLATFIALGILQNISRRNKASKIVSIRHF